MRERMFVTKTWAADAAGIDDQPSVPKSYGTGEMGVGAQDQRLRDTLRKLFDAIERRQRHRAVGMHGMEPIDFVIVGRRMTHENLLAKHARHRLRAQPFELLRLEGGIGPTTPP